MTRKTETIAHLDASIARWKTRLKRSVTMIDKLEKKRRRLAAKALVANVIDPLVEALKPESKVTASTLVAAVKGHINRVKVTSEPVANPDNVKLTFAPVKPDPDANLDIPGFLRRQPEPSPEAEQIKAEQATVKKAKAAGRIAKMKAKKAGELKKMPLSGKAALDAIRNG
jgi:hypothetical protein